ncbi:AMP-binding protein [Streptomyces arenae]|uniref:AMP-binding protein n=1 Tax=Streptomyces arenae TaxID=29301 RepID=UPI002659EAA5|nr:AMP-binding protein [Streptomyces arenae]MCG7203686.1 AMP-binding protein [Streptomyces arenae]
MHQPTASWIRHHARRVPDRTALVDLDTGRTTSYAALAARVDSLAHSLTVNGVGRGSRVAVLSRNDPRLFEVLYACAAIGAVMVPLNWRLTASELAAIVADAEPTVLLHDAPGSEVAARIAAGTPVPTVLGWTDRKAAPDPYEEWATAPLPPGWTAARVEEDAVWAIIYTSGTTGRPKGVQITHRSMLASMLGILVAHGVSGASRALTVLPLFHVAGLNLFANPVLYAGGTVVVARAFDAATTLALLTDTGTPVTHFCGVPANYQFMQQLPDFDSAELRPFTAVVGGSPVPSALLGHWKELGVPLTPVFGITEAGACVTSVPPDHDAAPGVIGIPTLYARCRVRTSDGVDAAPGQTGELQVNGPLVTPGYWRAPEATAEAFTADGWLRTGDAAAVTEDGMLVLVDRWKDMYISGGENVYPAEVENVLHEHPEVSQAAVVGTPHARWGESGAAFVVPVKGTEPRPDDLVRWCKEHLAAYKVPASVTVVDDLPRNATGKVLKAPLRERAAHRVNP